MVSVLPAAATHAEPCSQPSGAGGLSHVGKVLFASWLHTCCVTLRRAAVAPEDAGVKQGSGVHAMTAGAGAVQGSCRGGATRAGCACALSWGTSWSGGHRRHNPASGGAPTVHSSAREALIPFSQLS